MRAFRGTRRSSRYREHLVPAAGLARACAAAASAGLPLLASVAPRESEPVELDRRDARRLAEEATRLRATAAVVDLDAELVALAELAHWCGRSTERSWLRLRSV